jgi:hypothetical protein
MVKRKLKVYGTRRRGHREKHYVKKEGKYRYFEVRRDAKGHFLYKKKWNPKKPLKAETYTELHPLVIPYETGREALEKVREAVKMWEWAEFDAES